MASNYDPRDQEMRELCCDDSKLTTTDRRVLMLRAGLRAGWDDPEMDVYNDLDPRR